MRLHLILIINNKLTDIFGYQMTGLPFTDVLVVSQGVMAEGNSRKRQAGIKLFFGPPAKSKPTDKTEQQVESNRVVVSGDDATEQQLQVRL